jgi:ribosome assembly protein YihI (activator of Der GTPase)
MTLSSTPSNRSRDKDKKKKTKKKKKRNKKHKKKRSGSSSSSTSSSRSRSGGSSSVSSGEKKKKPLRWKIDAKDKKVPLSSLTHVAQLKLKNLKRGDLVSFAARHPGALTAQQFSGLTEVRDMKEVVMSAEILDAVNREEISQALDVLCQRILTIQAAKQKGGTWEKAEAIELVGNRKSLVSTSMLALTNQ